MKPTSLFIAAYLSSVQSLNTWTDGPTYDIGYDTTAKKLKFTVTVPPNMWFGLAFGKNMMNTDIIAF